MAVTYGSQTMFTLRQKEKESVRSEAFKDSHVAGCG